MRWPSASPVDELGRCVDHLRQVGIRGFLAEHTNDSDFAKPPGKRSADYAARAGSGADAPRRQTRDKR